MLSKRNADPLGIEWPLDYIDASLNSLRRAQRGRQPAGHLPNLGVIILPRRSSRGLLVSWKRSFWRSTRKSSGFGMGIWRSRLRRRQATPPKSRARHPLVDARVAGFSRGVSSLRLLCPPNCSGSRRTGPPRPKVHQEIIPCEIPTLLFFWGFVAAVILWAGVAALTPMLGPGPAAFGNTGSGSLGAGPRAWGWMHPWGGGPFVLSQSGGAPQIADVERVMNQWIGWHGNPRLKLGPVTEKDSSAYGVDVVTKEGSLVQRLEVDRNTGRITPMED